MYKKSIIFLTSCSLCITLYAQNKVEVSGKVVDQDEQEVLIGAQISSDSNTGTITDKHGNFTLELPAGQQEITVSYLGYLPRTIAVNTDSADLGTIELMVSPTSLDEIIVSATMQNYRSDFKGSNFRIGPEKIKNTNPLNTEEILRTIPGVNIVGDMGLSNRPNISIRGSWGRRSKKVLLMEDGSPAAPAPYIAPGAYYNPVSDRIKAIEVYKGADMLRFGPNNMYGGINYVTALPPSKPELRLKLVGGQRNYATGLFSYGGTWNNLGALVEAVYKKFDGFTDNASVEVLNLNAKIFAQLSENQSLYFKVSGQFEDNQASLSSITPFTFETDPTENPFDADIFTMRRYGMDIIHKWLPQSNISLTSKIYASDFERDWWRQVTTKIKASEVRSYVGEQIFNDRYRYLDGLTIDEYDYVRVGKITNGRESTTDSRWIFTVSGLQETFNLDWSSWGEEHHLEVGFKLHQETYKDRFLVADSSRWARSGNPATDLHYYLWSASGYIRNEFNLDKFNITPIIRFEHINMYRQDLLALAQDPDIGSLEEGRLSNKYTVALPGITVGYKIPKGEIYGSVYQGFIAPSKVFGFFVERNGVLTNPFADENINVQPELSLNTEIGWRGSIWHNVIEGQLAYFNNTIRNFVAGGENEIFQEPGKMNVQGLETGLVAHLIANSSMHRLRVHLNATFLDSKVLDGALVDKDMFGQIVHNPATRQEFLDNVNTHRQAYDIYKINNQGNEVIYDEATLTESDFDHISKAVVRFGEGYIEDAEAPYTPHVNISSGLSYDYKKLSAGITGNYIGEQYTEFMNFEHESADGAIGKLPSFFTLDAYVNYDLSFQNNTNVNFFINAKNITDQIYRASRLNRAASGIFPGGFREIIMGVNIRL